MTTCALQFRGVTACGQPATGVLVAMCVHEHQHSKPVCDDHSNLAPGFARNPTGTGCVGACPSAHCGQDLHQVRVIALDEAMST